MNWNDVLPAARCSYVLGNPPFIGKKEQNLEQKADMAHIWGEVKGAGVLDYVTAWYLQAARYITGTAATMSPGRVGVSPADLGILPKSAPYPGHAALPFDAAHSMGRIPQDAEPGGRDAHPTRIPVAFVSTNSISQGEQVGILWNHLFQRHAIKIHFAHRTFAWMSEARGKAHVHVVIIGFGAWNRPGKQIHDYYDDKFTIAPATNISPYLVEGNDVVLSSRSTPICDVPPCEYGNKPTDDGNLIVEEEDREFFLATNPLAQKYLRPLLCAHEYFHAIPRWCLWLVGAVPADLRASPGLLGRIEAVRDFRLASKKAPTREQAHQPTLFAEIRQPQSRYIVVPQHSSENRRYIPFGYFEPEMIVHNSCSCIPDATLYHLGVLTSLMHMAWLRAVCGRIKSDFRYSVVNRPLFIIDHRDIRSLGSRILTLIVIGYAGM